MNNHSHDKDTLKSMFKSINSVNTGLKDIMKTQFELVKNNFIHKKNGYSFSQIDTKEVKKIIPIFHPKKVKKFLEDGPLNIDKLIDY
jgi:hypothetical protein